MKREKFGPWKRTYLREWREHKGLTLEEVSRKMGLSQSQLGKTERGIHRYNQRVLELAAQEYGCTVQDLLTRPPDDPDDIFIIYEKLSPAQRRQGRRLLRTLIETDESAP